MFVSVLYLLTELIPFLPDLFFNVQVYNRTFFGVCVILFSAFDLHDSNPTVDANGNLSGAKIWELASTFWL